MTPCELVQFASAYEKLSPAETTLARDIIETYGEEKFHHFLLHRAVLMQQTRVSLPPLFATPVVPEHGH